MKQMEFARMSALQVKRGDTLKLPLYSVDQEVFICLIFSTWQADNHRQIFRLSDSKINLEFPSGQPLVSSHVCWV